MRTAVATFPRRPGERRIEVDLEKRRVTISFYVPRLGKAPVVDHETAIAEAELDAHIAALTNAREQLRTARRA